MLHDPDSTTTEYVSLRSGFAFGISVLDSLWISGREIEGWGLIFPSALSCALFECFMRQSYQIHGESQEKKYLRNERQKVIKRVNKAEGRATLLPWNGEGCNGL